MVRFGLLASRAFYYCSRGRGSGQDCTALSRNPAIKIARSAMGGWIAKPLTRHGPRCSVAQVRWTVIRTRAPGTAAPGRCGHHFQSLGQ